MSPTLKFVKNYKKFKEKLCSGHSKVHFGTIVEGSLGRGVHGGGGGGGGGSRLPD